MMDMHEFDAENCPLDGMNLVEASAGTGKTYNIQLLVLRLLLEKAVPLRKILVVTFTVFATGELINRLHAILLLTSRAFDLCRENASAIDAGEFGQVRNIVRREVAKGEARRRECVALIRTALADFDQAAVMTIHGFCQRMLVDNAFASNVSFGVELRESIGDLRHRIAMDFIRIIRCSTRPGFVLGKKLDGAITADSLLDKLAPALGNLENGADIRWEPPSSGDPAGGNVPPPPPPDDASWEEQLEALNAKAAAAEDGKFKPGALGPCFLAFYRERLAKSKAEENFFTFDDLIRLMAEIVKEEKRGAALRAAIRENFQYAFVDEFQDTDPLQYEIFSRLFGGDEKDEDRGFFMIGDPKQAIYSFRGGDIFAYRTACAEVPEDRRYTLSRNFRSSEAYIAALNRFFGHKDFPDQLEVPAINYGGTEKAVLCKDGHPVDAKDLLQFEAVDSQSIGEITVLKIRELLCAGYTLRDKGEDKPVTASDIAVLFPTKGKGIEIETMLNRAGIDTVWMSESDIFQRPEAQSLYDLLKMLYDGCPFHEVLAVLAGDIFQCSAAELCRLRKNGVFAEDEMKKFEGLAEQAQAYFLDLRKIWENRGFYVMFRKLLFAPNSEGRQWLTAIRDDAPEGRFEKDGTLARHLIDCHFIAGRYELGHLRQLGELLHQSEQARQLPPGRLLNHLLGRIEHDGSDDDGDDAAALIQRSTDLAAVRLLTLHKSKGLQFPIVIIPFFVTHINNQKPARLFHDGSARCVDMTGWSVGDKARFRGYKEACTADRLDEKTRLLYVGVTRAKYFCYLSLADKYGDSTFRGMVPFDAFPAKHDAFEVKPPDEKRSAGVSHVRSFGGSPVCDWYPVSFSGFTRSRSGDGVSPAPGAISPQDLSGGTDEGAEDDALETSTDAILCGELPGDGEQAGIFDFGYGSGMGTVWHKIFEKMDFSPSGLSDDGLFDESECEAVLAAISDDSASYRYIRKSRDEDEVSRSRDVAFARMLKGILCNPLGRLDDPAGERFRLRDIPPCRRASELKFLFVLKENVTLTDLKTCLEKYGYPTGDWAKTAVAGYVDHPMTGFIDLLCQSASGKYYIIDWKSNRLDVELKNFGRDGMAAEVGKELYFLQYLIYTVALWHFLKARQGIELTGENYEKYFGGVLYLFIRGIAAPLPGMTEGERKACRERGIYFDRPPFELVSRLKNLLDIRSSAPSAGAEPTRDAAAEAEK